MDTLFIAERITELRIARKVSEYQMSLELGQSKGYIQGITSGRRVPSIKQLFNIADYFHITLSEFFDDGKHESPAFIKAVEAMRRLDDSDIELIMGFIQRILSRDYY